MLFDICYFRIYKSRLTIAVSLLPLITTLFMKPTQPSISDFDAACNPPWHHRFNFDFLIFDLRFFFKEIASVFLKEIARNYSEIPRKDFSINNFWLISGNFFPLQFFNSSILFPSIISGNFFPLQSFNSSILLNFCFNFERSDQLELKNWRIEKSEICVTLNYLREIKFLWFLWFLCDLKNFCVR